MFEALGILPVRKLLLALLLLRLPAQLLGKVLVADLWLLLQ